MGIGLITGCDRDMDALPEGTLLIYSLTPEDGGEKDLQINQTITVEAKVNYSGDAAELTYNWHIEEGEIHPKGRGVLVPTPSTGNSKNPYETYNIVVKATYVTPAKKGTYPIEFKVCNGAVTVSNKILIKVGDSSLIDMTSDTSETTGQANSGGSEADESAKQN